MKTRTRIAAATATVAALAALGLSSDLFARPVTVSPTRHTQITTGILDIQLRDGSATWQQTLDPIAPGDRTISQVALVNVGDAPLGNLKITSAAQGALFAGAHPAVVSLKTCAVPFTNASCPAGVTNLTGNIVGAPAETTLRLNQGQRIYLQIEAGMPSSADNTYQGAAGRLDYVFNGTQAPLEQPPTPRGKR